MYEDVKFSIVNHYQGYQLQKVAKNTFIQAFAKDNTEENLNSYLASAFNVESLIIEISDPNSNYYFIEIEEEIAGYFKINIGESQTEIKADNGLELERIYILEEYQGKKIGEKVLEEIKKIARLKIKQYIWLGVWEQNLKAIKFYRRMGFKKFDTHIYPIGNDPQIDWMMKLML